MRLTGGRAPLVGLQSSRDLVQLIAHDHGLGMKVEAVATTCPLIPRGWTFTGRVE